MYEIYAKKDKLDIKDIEPNFDWNNKNLWINNPSAVKYWMNTGNSINTFKKLYKQHLDELDNTNLTKTY